MYIIAIIFVINVFTYCLDVFDNYMQQDAHEFFNYLLNTIGDLLQGTVCASYMLYLITVCENGMCT
jgi:ubiquitin C-terminal hydrolase